MDITKASGYLMDWYLNRESFSIPGDFDLLLETYKEEDTNANRAAIISALERLKESKLVDVQTFGDADTETEDIYVRHRNFQSFSQNVEISGRTAEAVAKVINVCLDELNKNEEGKEYSDPFNITEKDIQGLTFLIHHFISSNQEESEKPKTKPTSTVKLPKNLPELGDNFNN